MEDSKDSLDLLLKILGCSTGVHARAARALAGLGGGEKPQSSPLGLSSGPVAAEESYHWNAFGVRGTPDAPILSLPSPAPQLGPLSPLSPCLAPLGVGTAQDATPRKEGTGLFRGRGPNAPSLWGPPSTQGIAPKLLESTGMWGGASRSKCGPYLPTSHQSAAAASAAAQDKADSSQSFFGDACSGVNLPKVCPGTSLTSSSLLVDSILDQMSPGPMHDSPSGAKTLPSVVGAQLSPSPQQDARQNAPGYTTGLPDGHQGSGSSWVWLSALKNLAGEVLPSDCKSPTGAPGVDTRLLGEIQKSTDTPSARGLNDSLLSQLQLAVEEMRKAPPHGPTAEGQVPVSPEKRQPHGSFAQLPMLQDSRQDGESDALVQLLSCSGQSSGTAVTGLIEYMQGLGAGTDSRGDPRSRSRAVQSCDVSLHGVSQNDPGSPSLKLDTCSSRLASNGGPPSPRATKSGVPNCQRTPKRMQQSGQGPNRKKILKERERRSSIRQNIKRLRSALPRDIADDFAADTASIIDAAVKYILELRGSAGSTKADDKP